MPRVRDGDNAGDGRSTSREASRFHLRVRPGVGGRSACRRVIEDGAAAPGRWAWQMIPARIRCTPLHFGERMVVDAGSVRPDAPRLTVVGSGEGPRQRAGTLQDWAIDGTAATTVGSAAAAGFGVEIVKSFAVAEPAGRWWLVLAFVVGVALIVTGLVQRAAARRAVRVGIVVTALDARRSLARAQQLAQQAEAYSRSACSVTLKTSVELPQDRSWDRAIVDGLADETLTATALAERLTPDAARVNLIPTMPLHVAFWFGARLGYTHARDVVVHSILQGDGAPAYFPAVSLRTTDSVGQPLLVDRLEAIDGGDLTAVALALDLQGRGDQFFDAVTAACRQHGFGTLLRVRSRTDRLPENRDTFTAVVEQTRRAWLDAPLTEGARTGRHAIFLSGPVAVSVALGARLAGPDHGRWTAFTFDPVTSSYEAFPPPTST